MFVDRSLELRDGHVFQSAKANGFALGKLRDDPALLRLNASVTTQG